MTAVALGHWTAISVFVDVDGNLTAGNALDLAPRFAPVTWLLQVMPLFFVVGGFASAASLDAHRRDPQATGAAWVASRLRRLFAPVAVSAVGRVERTALLATRVASVRSYPALLATAGALSMAVKGAWTSRTPIGVVAGTTIVLGLHHLVLRRPDRTIARTVGAGLEATGRALRTGRMIG